MTDAFRRADDGKRLDQLVSLGTVVEFDLAARPVTARVEFEEGWVSDDLPVFQLSAGRVRSWSAPVIGEQVMVIAPSGELGAAWALRGLPYGAFAATSAEALTTILAEWADGAADAYDEAAHARTITIPAGGSLTVNVGGKTLVIGEDGVSIDAAGGDISLTGGAITLTGAITLDGPVNLGGEGGQPVARVGDDVVGGKITTGSSTVRAS